MLAWLREAAQHAERLEEVLLADLRLKRGRLALLGESTAHSERSNLTSRLCNARRARIISGLPKSY